jgi:class 3 adenylate cyclase
VLFADIKGSLELIESSDPEQAHVLLNSAIGAMMNAVHRFEGTDKSGGPGWFLGQAAIAGFGGNGVV